MEASETMEHIFYSVLFYCESAAASTGSNSFELQVNEASTEIQEGYEYSCFQLLVHLLANLFTDVYFLSIYILYTLTLSVFIVQ